MDYTLHVNRGISINKEVAPFVIKNLNLSGFALIKLDTEHDDKKLESDLLLYIAAIGQSIAKDISYFTLEGQSAEIKLPAHVEGIYASQGITSGFVLGCIKPANTGGETRLFDAKRAAGLIKNKYTDLAQILIEYKSKSYPNEIAKYHLIEQDSEYGDVLRYRSNGEGNTIIESKRGLDINNFYKTVDSVLEQCILVEHKWQRGDMLFVNNKITLHDRKPYTGIRKMLRVRFGDYLNKALTY